MLEDTPIINERQCEDPFGVMNAVLEGLLWLMPSQRCYYKGCTPVVRLVYQVLLWLVIHLARWCETCLNGNCEKCGEKAMTKIMSLYLHQEGTEVNAATLGGI